MSALLAKKLKRAHDHLQQGDGARARALCEEVLRDAPRNPDALYLYGVACLAGGRPQDAVAPLKRLLAADPQNLPALEYLGLAHLMLGEHAEAEYALSIAAASPHAPASALMRLGVAILEQGRTAEAVPVLRKALELDSQDVTCRLNLGRALAHAGDVAAARREFESILRVAPGHFDAMFNLGVLDLGANELADARRWFERIIDKSPGYADAHVNLGIVHQREGRFDKAVACFRWALALDPGLTLAGASLASALSALGRYPEAIAQLREFLRRNENDGWAWGALAEALFQAGELAEATQAATRARALDAGSTHPYSVLALIHTMRGEIGAAIAVLQDGCERTGSRGLASMLAHQLRRVCDWQRWRGTWEEVARGLDHDSELGSPFWLLIEPTTPTQQLDYTRRWASAHFGAAIGAAEAPRKERPARSSGDARRVRIGYLSSEFQDHAIAHLMAGVLEAHDRMQFEIYAYSYGPEDSGPMRARFIRACEHFVDIAREPDDIAVRRIEEDALDILVDLKGYTTGARTGILARRPCAIQVNFEGYPGTMGAPFIDYLIADSYVIPPGAEHAYSERIVRLSHCWQANDHSRPIVDPLTRDAYGLPMNGFVFCCFAQSAKITPEIFARWMNLLKSIAGSVLWLAEDNELATRNLRTAAAAHGIGSERLVLAPRAPFAQYLARYCVADLALDTFPYTSHSTASDALWRGCPLVALTGDTFASRGSGSILTHAGLADLITTSFDDYETLARRLATDPQFLAEVRSRVAAVGRSPLFDVVSMTRDLERVYRELVWGQSKISADPS